MKNRTTKNGKAQNGHFLSRAGGLFGRSGLAVPLRKRTTERHGGD